MDNKPESENETSQTKSSATLYATDLTVQLKKGLLTQCVLLVTEQPIYTSEILAALGQADLEIVEGTLYPLLSRLSRDGLLSHSWQESKQGPPRKYYQITEFGRAVRDELGAAIGQLNQVMTELERKSMSGKGQGGKQKVSKPAMIRRTRKEKR